MKLWFLFLFFLVCILNLYSMNMNQSQVVKGKVINLKNQLPVSGARISIAEIQKGAIAKTNGEFRIEDVKPGRYTLTVSSVGYEPFVQQIVVTSGRQVIVSISLLESFVETEEVTVTANKNSFSAINESVLISSTQFSVDEAQRYAGSRMDPARMAQNFAGVLGANDTRNDIVIRGGSPIELLWRIDGMDIPNPNHFATQGATGGPVSAVNTMVLDNSDFLTGAYPAEYMDKMSGVFDLRTRTGNREKYEYIGQFGFNGIELGAEGPANENASFIANYRYSFLGLLEVMGIDFGFSGIPEFQDATLVYDWDINDKNRLSYTGIFGISDIFIKESETDDVFTGDFDIQNGTDFFANSVRLRTIFNDKFYTNVIIGFNYQGYRTQLDSITTDQNNNPIDFDKWVENESVEGFYNAKVVGNYSLNRKNQLSFGTETRYRFYDLYEQRFTVAWDSDELFNLSEDGNAVQQLSFINWNLRATEDITLNLGVSSQYFTLNDDITFEPRASLSWAVSPQHSFNFGWGIYDQSLPLITYFAEEGNEDLEFMQSVHYVAGYNFVINEKSYLKAEAYLKDISSVPIDRDPTGTNSFLNSGTTFGNIGFDEFVSDGLGQTYGAELSYFRNFADGYYITSTLSYVRQRYKAADGKWRWGAFDNQFIFNFLAGYEIKLSEKNTIELSIRYTHAGGSPYTPVDIEQSLIAGSTVYDDEQRFELRAPDYSRLDARIDFRQNFSGYSVISYFSVENALGRENLQGFVFDFQNLENQRINQLGIFPVGGVRIEF